MVDGEVVEDVEDVDVVEVEFDAQWPHYERAWRTFWPWQSGWRHRLARVAIGVGLVVYGARPGPANPYLAGVIAALGLWAALDAGHDLFSAWRGPARSWNEHHLGRRRFRYRFGPEGLETTTRGTRRYRWSEVEDLRADDLVLALRLSTPAIAWVPREALAADQVARVQAWWVAGKGDVPEPLAAPTPSSGPWVLPDRWLVLARFTTLAAALALAAYVAPWAWRAVTGIDPSTACGLLRREEVQSATGRGVRSVAPVQPDERTQGASICRWTLDGGGEVTALRADDGSVLYSVLATVTELPATAQAAPASDGEPTSSNRTFVAGRAMVQLRLTGIDEAQGTATELQRAVLARFP